MKILRARPTRYFLYLLVRCRCGKRFGHRADRRLIVCYSCGRIADLLTLRRNRSRTASVHGSNGSGKARAVARRAPANGKARAIAHRAPARRARKGASTSR